MKATLGKDIEFEFSLLPSEEKISIISYGAALRLSALRRRLFLAESKVRHFQEKYRTSLAEFDAEGLPDDADYEMHEDYIMWHHWEEVAEKLREQIALLEPLVAREIYTGEGFDVGD